MEPEVTGYPPRQKNKTVLIVEADDDQTESPPWPDRQARTLKLSSIPSIIDLYVVFAVLTACIQVVYMAIVGSFPFNSFLSGVLSCIGTAVLAVCLRIQVNKENKEFKDLPPERAFADFVLCNLVLHLVIINFLG
ncbi:Defender against cell death 1 [Morus notabilis]|uniref:Dolichyl-diphosphooligosaccharide--protein glycosyltransferase subunit DAD1 n=1 Tax=Morus notabilis TaxID=981085 RepID=W9SFK2_9ROSA|nr:Defender against cell death 1 [Morus notabilis]